MKNSIFLFVVISYIALSGPVLAASNPQVQTYSATNVQNTSAILQGNLYDMGSYGSVTVWFQWGIDINYGNATNQVAQNYTGTFSQQIVNLSPNQTFHYRAVAQNNYGTSYGQDMQFTTGQSSNQPMSVSAGPNLYLSSGQTGVLQGSAYSPNASYINYSWTCSGGTLSNNNIAQPTYTAPSVNQYNNQTTYTCTLTASNNVGQSNSSSMKVYVNYGSGNYGTLLINKWVRNLSSGNLQWSGAATASPSDVMQFSVTVQTSALQSIHNITLRDALPVNLIYNNNVTVDGSAFGGNITQGINIGDLPAGQIKTITYQAQVASAGNFSFGQTTLVNSVFATSSETNGNTASATVYVTKTGLLGATSVSTGLTNDFLTDSFFLPLVLLVAGLWLWKSGILSRLAR